MTIRITHRRIRRAAVLALRATIITPLAAMWAAGIIANQCAEYCARKLPRVDD